MPDYARILAWASETGRLPSGWALNGDDPDTGLIWDEAALGRPAPTTAELDALVTDFEIEKDDLTALSLEDIERLLLKVPGINAATIRQAKRDRGKPF